MLLHFPAIHHGRNIRRFRHALGLDAEQLAQRLGTAWTTRQVMEMEAQPVLSLPLLVQVAEALCIPAALLCRLEEEKLQLVPADPFPDSGNGPAMVTDVFRNCPDLLHAGRMATKLADLYERLLVSEREKADLRAQLYKGRYGV
jgi:hypothetical protein